MNEEEVRQDLIDEAEDYKKLRMDASSRYLDGSTFLKGAINDWAYSVAAVCFAIGGVAFSVSASLEARSAIAHPGAFWTGASLLIVNGIFLFFSTRHDLANDYGDMSTVMPEMEADLFTMEKIALAKAKGDESRVGEFKRLTERVSSQYEKHHERQANANALWRVIGELTTEIATGVLIISILLMASQVSDSVIAFENYMVNLAILFALYLTYVFNEGLKNVNRNRRRTAANQRIRNEVFRVE